MKQIFISNKSAISKVPIVVVVVIILAVIIGAVVLNQNPASREFDLEEAIEKNLVQATITGDGLEHMDVTLEAIGDKALTVTVPVGAILEAQSEDVQHMVVIEPTVFALESNGSVHHSVSVAGIRMWEDVPSGDDEFGAINFVFLEDDVFTLLDLPAFHDETFRVKQFAIWTITDNPWFVEYVGIGTSGSGPSDEEMSRILNLFEAAGISTDEYHGFVPPLEVDLGEALAEGLVRATVSGKANLEYLELTLASSTDQPLIVTVPVGTIFKAQSENVQVMVVIEPMVFPLGVSRFGKGGFGERTVSVASITMWEDVPDGVSSFSHSSNFLSEPSFSDVLVMSNDPISTDLAALLNLPAFHDETLRVKQFSIWTITDNPPWHGYAGVFDMFDLGPSKEERPRIRGLFEAAGISTNKYQGLIPSLEVDLGEAVAEGLVQATIKGRGNLGDMYVKVESIADKPLTVTVPAGTIFGAQSENVQNMVTIEPFVFHLESNRSAYDTISVACANMMRGVPDNDDVFSVSSDSISADLAALLNLPAFHSNESSSVQQFAVWTITDNPPRDGYRSINTYMGRLLISSLKMDDDKLSRIRNLFEAAGISTNKYQAFS